MLIKVKNEKLEVRIGEPEARRDIFEFKTVLFGICFLFFGISSYAQCAMCRAALTSEGNKTKAEAVNDGIVYLMVIPYVLVGLIGYAVYRMKKKQ
jgi:uncharacterized membrane protein